MSINIDQQRLEEYEGAKDWNAGTDLTPKWEGAKDWTPPVYAEGEEPPLQWLLDAGLPFILGGGAGAAVYGRKKIAKKAMDVLNKLQKTHMKKLPSSVPLYNKAGQVIGVDKRATSIAGIDKTVKKALQRPNPTSSGIGLDIPYQNPMTMGRPYQNPRGMSIGIEDEIARLSGILGLKNNLKYLSKMPNVAKEAYKASRIKQQQELAKKLTDMVDYSHTGRLGVKGAEKVYRPSYKGPHPEYRDIGPISMNSPFYGTHNVSEAKKLAGGTVKEHMKQSILKSNPDITKKGITDKIIDTLLGID